MKKVIALIVLAAILAIIFVFSNKSEDAVQMPEEEKVAESPIVLSLFEDVEVGDKLSRSLETEEGTKVFQGIEFTLTPNPQPPVVGQETVLIYNLRIDGRPATEMQTEDGVYGKGATVHRESLEQVPVEIIRKVTPHGTLEFRTVFPQAGEYVIFTQFKRGGNFVTTDFLVSVR